MRHAPRRIWSKASASAKLAISVALLAGTFTVSLAGLEAATQLPASATAGTPCTWSSTSPAATLFAQGNGWDEVKQGSQASFGSAVTGGITAGSSTFNPGCSGISVPA